MWKKSNAFLGRLYYCKVALNQWFDYCVTLPNDEEQCPACLVAFSDKNPQIRYVYEKEIVHDTDCDLITVKTHICPDCHKDVDDETVTALKRSASEQYEAVT